MVSPIFSQFQRNIVITWLLPQRIILIQAQGTITRQQREWAHAEIIALIHSCSTPAVHLISDTQQMKHIDWSVFSRPSGLHAHPRRGWWINIGTVPMVPSAWLSRLLARTLRRQYIYRSSMQEALETLQTLDPTLPELSRLTHAALLEAHS